MGKVNMKGATPVGSASLCRTCSHAHILSGYRESEMMVVCTATSADFPVPFIVRECSGYNDKNRPNWTQMQKLAIHVAPPREAKVGFRTRTRERESEPDPVNNN